MMKVRFPRKAQADGYAAEPRTDEWAVTVEDEDTTAEAAFEKAVS